MEEKVLIEAKNLKKYFKVGANSQLHAVDGVNFKIKRGTTLGVVGESGCGKSTLGRLLLRLYDVTDGQIIYDGTDITKLNAKELKPIRARMQMIFSGSPISSFTLLRGSSEPDRSWKIICIRARMGLSSLAFSFVMLPMVRSSTTAPTSQN